MNNINYIAIQFAFFALIHNTVFTVSFHPVWLYMLVSCVIINNNLTGIRYRDDIIRPDVLPFVQAQGHNILLQQDNARPHNARVITNFLRQQNIAVLPWLLVSPDLSPTEQVWDEMERRVRRVQNQLVMLAQLGQTLIQIWNSIPQAFFNLQSLSMRRRCQACINTNGGHAPY